MKQWEKEILEFGDHVTPEQVVDRARNPESDLHGKFNWNVEEAARQHWLDTARTLIRSVKVVVEHSEHRIHAVAYVRDPEMGDKEQGYVRVARLKSDRERALEAVEYELRRAHSAMERAKSVADALGCSGDINAILDELAGLRVKLDLAA